MATKQTPTIVGEAAVPAPLELKQGALAQVLGAEFAQELAEKAKDQAAQERPSLSKISLRGGILTYMGTPVKGNKLPVVIVGMGFERLYYKDAYNPNVVVNPTCFSLKMTDEDMVPHENVKEPIHDNCTDCKFNRWATDPRPGSRGKACKEKRRLIMLPESALETPDDVRKTEMAFVSVPVTSVRGWSQYVNVLNATMQAPYFAVVTELGLESDPKTQYKLTFNALRLVDNADVLRAVMARVEEANKLALMPWDETAGQDQQAPTSGPNKF